MRTVPRELLAPESLNASTKEAMAFVVHEESLQQGGSKPWEQRHSSLARLGLVPRTSLQDPPPALPGAFLPPKSSLCFRGEQGGFCLTSCVPVTAHYLSQLALLCSSARAKLPEKHLVQI